MKIEELMAKTTSHISQDLKVFCLLLSIPMMTLLKKVWIE